MLNIIGKKLNTLVRASKPSINGVNSKFCVVLGSQWGDEGKGKLVDILAKDFNICARFNGGANAGHTVVAGGKKYAFHLLPCGILYETCKNVVGNGVVIQLPTLFEELEQLDKNGVNYKDRLFLSRRAHLVSNLHLLADASHETSRGASSIGTTKRGIGPAYSTKMQRIGIRVGDLVDWSSFEDKYKAFAKDISKMYGIEGFDQSKELDEFKKYREIIMKRKMIIDSTSFMHEAIVNGESILAEGANAAMLDIDFGTYPYVTSSNTSIGGVITGLGIPPHVIETTLGVIKAYTTRVGGGPFPTECLNDEAQIGDHLQKVGQEVGATTGRKRRCGWLDLNVVKYAIRLNGFNSFNLTKLDVLDDVKELKIATHYEIDGKVYDGEFPSTMEELAKAKVQYIKMPGWQSNISKIREFKDLPKQAQDYVLKIEELIGVPITWVGVGPEREAVLHKSL